MEALRYPAVFAQWTHEAAHEGRAHRHSKRKTVCSLTQFLVERKESHLSGALFLRVTRSLWAHAFQTKACMLHFSMYFARVSLSLSLHVFVLPVSCSRMSRHFVYVFYTLSGMHTYQESYASFTVLIPHSFLFVAVCAKPPHSAQATGRALCAQNGTRTQRPHNAQDTLQHTAR